MPDTICVPLTCTNTQDRTRIRRGADAILAAAAEEAEDAESVATTTGRALQVVESAPHHFDTDYELFAHMGGDGWATVKKVDPSLIVDGEVREALVWQQERREPATRTDLCDKFPELARDAERALRAPLTSPSYLVEKLHERYLINQGRDALKKVAQQFTNDPTQLPKLLEQAGNELKEHGVGRSSAWKFHSMEELSERGFKVEWLIKGWWIAGSHGMLAGMEKSLKTWIAAFEAVSIASGEPLFGRFNVISPGPVLIFTGESKAELMWDRLKHVARGLGIEDDLNGLPIYVCDELGALSGESFKQALRENVKRHKPVLVIIDPLYTYVDGNTEAGNVFAMGENLNAVSSITSESTVALKIGNHLRKSAGSNPGLADITQAGSREWVESWQLVSHREEPDLDEQAFKLSLKIGSRYGFGSYWDLDINLGRFDEMTLRHEGKPTWNIERISESDAKEREEKHDATLKKYAATLREMKGATVLTFSATADVGDKTARKWLNELVEAELAIFTKRGKNHEKFYEAVS